MEISDRRALDAWMAEHVLLSADKMEPALIGNDVVYFSMEDPQDCFSPTTDSGSALDVWKAIQMAGHAVCSQKLESGEREVAKLQFYSSGISLDFSTVASTQELAICLFAKKLFPGAPAA